MPTEGAIVAGPTSGQASRSTQAGLKGFWQQHWLAIIFCALALAVRIAFWAYTGRVWEDTYITLQAVRNLWLGHGLTYQASQPRIETFTSPLSVLIPLLPQGIHQGLLAMRLSSLAGSVAAVVYAHRLLARLDVSKIAEGFALAYIALEHNQVYFGMAGMETQVAVAIILASAYYVYIRSWRAVGITCGLALLARPDFLLWVIPVGVAVLIWERRAFLRVVGYSALLYGPWVLFTTVYYGSPIPHTIAAKSLYPKGIGSLVQQVDKYLPKWQSIYEPFKDFLFVTRAPLPMWLLGLTSLMFVLFILAGCAAACVRFHGLLPVVAFVGLFFAYRTYEDIHPYSMWYLPPATAMGVILAAVGVDRIRRELRELPGLTEVVACAMAALFAIAVLWMMPLDRTTQVAIDQGVRGKVGMYLNRVMGPHDSVTLEPLGYVGWYAPNKIYYDYPGLASKTVTRVLARLPVGERTLPGLINALHPTYVALRPAEVYDLRHNYLATFRHYHVVRVFRAAPGLKLKFLGLHYGTDDDVFFVMKYFPRSGSA